MECTQNKHKYSHVTCQFCGKTICWECATGFLENIEERCVSEEEQSNYLNKNGGRAYRCTCGKWS